MLIGIDGNEANVNNRVGSNVYAYEVLRNLYFLEAKSENLRPELRSRELKAEFIIYLRDLPLDDLPKETKWWKYKVIGPKRLWTQIGLPIALYTQKEKLDVFFTPGHYAPRFCPFPLIISILDTSYLSFPEYFKKDDLYQLKNWTAYSVKKAKKILTISENSKKDIIKYYHRKPEDIIVVYPGYDKDRFDIKIKNQSFDFPSTLLGASAQDRKSKIPPTARLAFGGKNIKQKLKINGEYIVYVGTLQPRKNLIKLIQAFEKLKINNLKLVICGKKGWMYEEIFNKVKELDLEKEVIFTGYVKDEDLPYLIVGAKLYVLPSLYEGFGIPVLEAMAVGTPVVISRVSSLPEVGGQAAIYINNPESVNEIASAILKGMNLKEKERNEIITRGLLQIKKFSWKKAAEQIINVLESVCSLSCLPPPDFACERTRWRAGKKVNRK